ncbi:MAG: epoxide hydrolase [Sphingomonadales bacterium]|nr:epoxide hydrolase [Sphingomonadales bacterium]
MTNLIKPFNLAVSENDLADLRDRLKHTRWPERETVADWSQGVPLDRLRSLCAYWADGYDWRVCERELNAIGQFHTEIDGLDIYFLHIRSPHAAALPMLVTHGWPGSIIEFRRVIDRLVDPVRFGGSPSDAFDLIIPALPGYAFSGKPTQPGWGVERIAGAWAVLMRRLGYDRYVAQGGDWGAMVTTALGMAAPPECIGIHINMPMVRPSREQLANLTESESKALEGMAFYEAWDSGYAKLQSTRPQTLGYGLADSPVGQAAWIYEKFHAWMDKGDGDELPVSLDDVLDNIMLYWLSNSGVSSGRLYWEVAGKFKPTAVGVPTGVSIFPGEIFRPSRRWVERRYSNICYWNEVERGGHFAAFEQPELYVQEMQNCFRPMRTS